jgi:predicted CoA-substrate-specific enzyme activase
LDIGSRTIKLAIVEQGNLADYCITDTGVNALDNVRAMLKRATYDQLTATGYGRYLMQTHLDCPVITEIKAYTLGANYLYPGANTIIDVGGQDCKIIQANGKHFEDFIMNDRCAAGTGRFLEIMATTLGFTIDQFGEEALKATKQITINSMCTVFAESEVISLISKGESPQNIARGLHDAVINRLIALIGRIDLADNIIFAGGVAKNTCMAKLLEERLGEKISIPEEPQTVGSIGAALAADNHNMIREKRENEI